MTKSKHFFSLPSFAVLVLVCFVLFHLASCARKMKFESSPVVPAAKGFVKIKTDKNKNRTIELNLTNLASPDRLVPAKNAYVVWMETEDNGVKNIGQLNSKSGLFSSQLKASLKTITPFQPVRFFVTAEDDPSVSFPGYQNVISTKQ